MKQIIYTCTRCGKRVGVEPRSADPRVVVDESLPLEWAEVHYRRIHTTVHNDQQQVLQTICTAHACGDCAKTLLNLIESSQSTQRQSA